LALQTIRAHGGRLYFEKRSELDPGAEFVVALPLIGADEPQSAGRMMDSTSEEHRTMVEVA
jgi:hypothetical protein